MAVNNLITLRKGTATEWAAADPILSSGEPGFDVTNNLLKIGDGTTTWLNLSPTITSDIQVYVKNNTGAALNKGQVVYINGALGNNPTIQLSIASGEATSSKTLGLLKQNLGINEFGYVVSEGILEGIDTDSASAAGDSMWLSPSVSGGIVYGLANKPSAPNHMVFLGYVLRKQLNNGKVYIKVQNGFELEELHNVAINGVSNGQFLQYNTGSGLWLASSSGNFTTLQVNGTGVSISGHSHTSSSITDFNSSVSGLLPVKNIVAGTGISISSVAGSFTINSTSTGGGGGGGGVVINNYSNNRILTSDGTSTGIDAESNLTFDGNRFTIYPTGSSDSSLEVNTSGVSIGKSALIYSTGQFVLSNGRFSSDGDAQNSQYILRVQTTGSSWTSLQNNGGSGVFLRPNKTYAFCASIVGRCTSVSNNAAYKLEGLVVNDINSPTIIGTPIKTILGETDSSWDVRSLISGTYLLFQVQGGSSQDINWVGSVSLLENGGQLAGSYIQSFVSKQYIVEWS